MALSTCESEYMALAAAMQEIIFLKQILGALLANFDPVCTMTTKAPLALLRILSIINGQNTYLSSFIFLRQHIMSGLVELKYVRSSENLADAFTKSISHGNLLKCGFVN